MDFERDLASFEKFDFLSYPWRWHGINEALGNQILSMRKCLETHKPIRLDIINCEGLTVVNHSFSADLYDKTFLSLLRTAIKNNMSDSFLIIYPSYNEIRKDGQIQPRGSIKG